MIYSSLIYWDFLHDLVYSVIEKNPQALENIDYTAEWDGPVCFVYWHQIYSVIIVFLSLFTLLSERSAHHRRKWITIDLMNNSPFRSTDACFAYFSVLVLGVCFYGCYCKLAPQPWWNAISSDHVGMRAIEPMRARPPLLSPGSCSHGCPSPPLPLQLEVRPHKASFLHTRNGETAQPLVWLVSVWHMFPFSHSVFGVMGDLSPPTCRILMEKGSHCLYGSHHLLGLWIFCLHSLMCSAAVCWRPGLGCCDYFLFFVSVNFLISYCYSVTQKKMYILTPLPQSAHHSLHVFFVSYIIFPLSYLKTSDF